MLVIYMFIAPGQGQTTPGVIFFIIIFIQSIESFAANLFKKMTL